jgi:hypothetical protein
MFKGSLNDKNTFIHDLNHRSYCSFYYFESYSEIAMTFVAYFDMREKTIFSFKWDGIFLTEKTCLCL